MDQVREVSQEMGYPSATKLWNEVRKRGINVTRVEVLKFVRSQPQRQVFQKRPAYEGRITATTINDRWVCDLIDYNAKPSVDKKGGGEPYQYILIVQDIFSRRIFAHALKTKDPEVCQQAFASIVGKAGATPDFLDTDNGNEWKGDFQQYLKDENIHHNISDARNKNARATLDVAIRGLREQISRIAAAEDRRDWASYLSRAVAAHNKTEHKSLMGRAPNEVAGDVDLQFNLRYKAAEDLQHNSKLIEDRGKRLERSGAFRDEEPIKNKFERAFTPRFEGVTHRVAKVVGPVVYDEQGKSYPTRHTQPVEPESGNVNTVGLQGGSDRIDRVRLAKLEPYRARIEAFVGDGKTENAVVRYMKELGMDQLTNAGFNFRNMLTLLGFSTGAGRGSSTAMVRNLAAPPAAVPPPRDGPVRRITGKRAPLSPAEAAPLAAVPPRNGPLRRIAGKRAPLTPAEAAANLRRRLRGKQPGI
jgi:hypothetical protein